jgi:NAD(P)-dependent dehydrogenase (short-subunit alcohol dehydrogenase family)
MTDFKGKTAFITGGASGIGLAIAKALAKEGVNIVIADLRQSAIDETLPIFTENGWPALGIRLDVTDREAYVKAADEAEAKFGKLHILVNNAGIGCAAGPLWAMSAKDTDFALDLNLRSVLNGIQIIVPRIIAHGESGHVVSTSSMNGICPVTGLGLYNLTKGAVVALTETLVGDLRDTNVGASVLCPGPHVTNLGVTSREVQAEILGEPLGELPQRPAPKGDEIAAFEKMRTLERSADQAGERVVRGIVRDDIYILTHSEFKKSFEARANAVLRAFPDEAPNEDFVKLFAMLLDNPTFAKQTQVPAL